jgi:AraC-like DNA-binding protein
MVLETDTVGGRVDRRARPRAALTAELIRHAYRPHRSWAELLRGLLEALADRSGATHGALALHGIGTLAFESTGGAFVAHWQDAGARPRNGHAQPGSLPNGAFRWSFPAKHAAGNGNSHSSMVVQPAVFPLRYGAAMLGELQLAWPGGRAAQDAHEALCEEFADRCALLAKRYVIQRWTGQRLGRPMMLVGASEGLFRLESFVEMASASALPALLTGEFGTEKALLAAAIHCCGPRAEGPFIEVNCADPAGTPASWFEQARGGTLFFNGIDELPAALQGQLPQHMHSRLCQWLSVPETRELRVVATCTADLRVQAGDGRFSRALLAELDFLSIRVPPLRERRDDIEALVAAAIERQGFDPGVLLTSDLIELCRAHAWPENLFELERVIARLAVMTKGRPIRYVDMLHHAPHMAAERRAATPRPAPPPPVPSRPKVTASAPDHWVRCAMTGNQQELGKLHDGLRKALLYLGEHHAEAVVQGQLAQQAHVSPSHLNFLFRSVLKTTFKSLLQRIRIERARQLLAADKHQRITDVALSVGFNDLSHFEKSFRRIIGISPREYRRTEAG